MDGEKIATSESSNSSPIYGQSSEARPGLGRRFIDSFKRDPNARPITKTTVEGGGGYDVEGAALATAESPLSRKLKGRHLQMIAIGGSIGSSTPLQRYVMNSICTCAHLKNSPVLTNFAGTGLFVGSGKALNSGGPASLLIAFGLIGVMLYATVHALGEMAVLFPVAGSFSAYSTRFLDPAWGFAMGWK